MTNNRFDSSRRRFLGTSLAGSAALMPAGLQALLPSTAQAEDFARHDDLWVEASIPKLQHLMATGRLSSIELTLGYLRRIRRFNPLLGAVIETNPEAIALAARLDHERRHGRIRGPLHGIPILLKDNIATDDHMATTAGSLALRRSRVPADASLVARLRAAGAIVLGKANLSEWANFRGFAPFNGWSARGGFSRCPYLLSNDPAGSSSGSAIAPAANLCAGAIGTETDGSILSPASNNLVFGLKPSMGLVSQRGIIPIAASQDTAGPMGRNVTDAAILLGVMQRNVASIDDIAIPRDYRPFLRQGSLAGARIGIDRRYFTEDYGGEPDLVAEVDKALDAMQALGATLVETDTGDPFAWFDAEFTVLLYEFKVQIAQYLAGLSHTRMRTLADLIAFNTANCDREMRYFGQEIFEQAEATSGNLTDPDYLAARSLCLQLTQNEGIDAAIARDRLDAIVAPGWSFASSVAAVAGYPSLSLPVGLTPAGRPAGLWMYGGYLQESKLLGYAYDLEQAIQPRSQPQFLDAVPETPPDAGLCVAPALAAANNASKITRRVRDRQMVRHMGTGKNLRRH